jgi:hypothetical protein
MMFIALLVWPRVCWGCRCLHPYIVVALTGIACMLTCGWGLAGVNSLAWDRVICPEGCAEDNAAGAGVGEGAAGVDVLLVSSSSFPS